jgi:hypothetical protein
VESARRKRLKRWKVVNYFSTNQPRLRPTTTRGASPTRKARLCSEAELDGDGLEEEATVQTLPLNNNNRLFPFDELLSLSLLPPVHRSSLFPPIRFRPSSTLLLYLLPKPIPSQECNLSAESSVLEHLYKPLTTDRELEKDSEVSSDVSRSADSETRG